LGPVPAGAVGLEIERQTVGGDGAYPIEAARC